MDAETKIKEKLKDLQRFKPLLEEMLKWSKVGEKNAGAHEKLQKMYEIVIGKIPCTKINNLIRIEEAILKWTEKKQVREAAKESPVILNRRQRMQKRLADIESLTKTQTRPVEVINIDSSDNDEDDDIQIVSYTSPQPKKDNPEKVENKSSNTEVEEKKFSSSINLKPEIKDEAENPHLDLEEGEIEDSDSIISIVDGTGVELEDVESEEEQEHVSKEEEHIPQVIELISKEKEHFPNDYSKEEKYISREEEQSSLDSIASYHDKPALKTYGCRKISKSENVSNDDLRSVLNAIRISKRQGDDEQNISDVKTNAIVNEPSALETSLRHFPVDETLVVKIHNRKAKKCEDDRVVNVKSKICSPSDNFKAKTDLQDRIEPIENTLKASRSMAEVSSNILLAGNVIPIISKKHKSSKQSHTVEETEIPGPISKKKNVRVIEIVTEEPKKESQQNANNAFERNTKKEKSKLHTSAFEEFLNKDAIGSNQDENKKPSSLKKKPDCKKHKESNQESSGENIPTAAIDTKTDISSITNNSDSQKIENGTTDKYLNILYNIDLTPDTESDLEKDQDLDIFDEAIYSGARRNCEADEYKRRTPDVSRAEVTNRRNSADKNKDLVEQNNYCEKGNTNGNQCSPSMKDTNLNILRIEHENVQRKQSIEEGEIHLIKEDSQTDKQTNPALSDNGELWLHDSDTEDFIKKLSLAIDSKSEPINTEEIPNHERSQVKSKFCGQALPNKKEASKVEKGVKQIVPVVEQKAIEIPNEMKDFLSNQSLHNTLEANPDEDGLAKRTENTCNVPISPTKRDPTLAKDAMQLPFFDFKNLKNSKTNLIEGNLGNSEEVLSTEKNGPGSEKENNSSATSNTLSEGTPTEVRPPNDNSTISKRVEFKPISQAMLNNILTKVKETLKKSLSKSENSVLELDTEPESRKNKLSELTSELELVDESTKKTLSPNMESTPFADVSTAGEAVSPQSGKPLFERRPERKSPETQEVRATANFNNQEPTENKDHTNVSINENETAVVNASVSQGQSKTSKIYNQLDEWANKDLSDLQDIRMKLEKQLGIDLATILQAEHDEEAIFSSDNDTLAMDVAQELEDATQDDFVDELREPAMSAFPFYDTPMNFFAQPNFPTSHNLPQCLGLPPEIKPNDPRLRSRLTLLYAKTTDSMQLRSPLIQRKPQVPTAVEILGSQAGKVQEEIHSACMKEIGDLNFQSSPKNTTHLNRPAASSSSNRPRARTYGEYKRLKKAALEAEADRKRAVVEAANRAHQMELEAERERLKTLEAEKKRLRFNEFQDDHDYETDAEIILATRKKKSHILSSSSETESQTKKSPTKQRLRKKRTRAKSPDLSSENEVEHVFSIDSDSTSNAKKSSKEKRENSLYLNESQENALENLLKNHNLTIDTNNKDQLKELAFTVMKSLLKEQKFEEFKKLLDSNQESNEGKIKKSVSPTASTSSKGAISNRELAALNKDLHEMFIRDDVLMIGRRKSSVRSLKRIEEHYKQVQVPTKSSANENLKADSGKVIKTVYSDEDADTDNFEEYAIQKKQKEEIINIAKICPTVKLKRLTQEEILKYTKSRHAAFSLDSTSQSTEDDHDLLKPMKAVPFAYGAARSQSQSGAVRRQSQSGRPRKDIKNTNPDWHYKNPFFYMYCLICCKKFANLVEHYVIKHPYSEVYIARLPPTELTKLSENPGKAKTTGEQSRNGKLKYSAQCFFCGNEMKGRFDQFSHHYATHTGEFPYECSACDFMSCFKSVATRHSRRQCIKDAKMLTYYSYDENATKINLFICTKCNYMQLHKANVVMHLRKAHECKFICDSDIRELLLLEYVEQNIEILNEPVTRAVKSDDVEIIFEIQTGGKIDLPIVKKDNESETDSVISDISIEIKPEIFKFDMPINQLTEQSTKIVPDLSKFNEQADQVVTVIHVPTAISNDIENKYAVKSNFEKLLQELNSDPSTSAESTEPLVVAKPKGNSPTETVLEKPIMVKCEPQEDGKTSNHEDRNETDKIKDKDINADESKKPNVSDSPTIKPKVEETNIKEENTQPPEDISAEGQENVITVIEIVNDEDEIQNDLPIVEPQPESKAEEEFAPLRIENVGYQKIRENEYVFRCFIEKCNFGVTISFQILKDHVNTEHDIKWSGKCNICKNELSALTGSQPLEEELNHMLAVHIKELPESNNDENHVRNLLKPWLKETKSQKNKILCESMLSERSLPRLFKCMGDDCSFTGDTKHQMSRHLAAHELYALGKPDNERPWLECSYCEFAAVKTLQILDHVDVVHSKSIFQCSRCFYRTCSTVNLDIHQDQHHRSNTDKNKTIRCSGNLIKIKNEVERINRLAAENIEALSCSVCGVEYIRRDLMIKHIQEDHREIGIPKGFPMGLFSCIFCKFETDGLEQIRSHMANRHPEEMLYIGVRGMVDKNNKDKASIAYIGSEEKDDEDSQPQPVKPEMESSELKKNYLNEIYETFKSHLMGLRDLEKLCNPSIIIDSDDESCGNEDAEVSDESSIALYQKLIETLKFFIKSQSGLNPCCICLEKINLEDQWGNHFKTAHASVKLNAFQMCPLCPTLCSFWTYPSHYLNTHNKPAKTYFCYFCGKNFNVLAAAKLHLMSHSVYEQAKLIRVKMRHEEEIIGERNDIDYQIILPRKYNRKIADVIKHMMGVLEKRKIAEGQIIKTPIDLDKFTIDLNESIRGLNYPIFVAAPMRFVCTHCSIQLTDERAFEQHFRATHSALKVFKCPHCEVTLFNLTDFDRIRDHIRLHSGVFFMCCFCKMYTSNRFHLMEHIKRYKRDSVPIVVYARTVVTVKHHYELIHWAPQSKTTGTKIKCLFCTALVDTHKDLETHLRDAHELIRQYQCDYCALRGEEETVDIHVMNNHLKVATNAGNNFSFRSKSIFQKSLNARKLIKRKSDDLDSVADSNNSTEKKNRLEDFIIELDCEDETENPQNSEDPARISVIKDPPVKEISVKCPSVKNSLLKDPPTKEATIKVHSIDESDVSDPPNEEITIREEETTLRDLLIKETPVKDSVIKEILVKDPLIKEAPEKDSLLKEILAKDPLIKEVPVNDLIKEIPTNDPVKDSPKKLKCDFCPLKCISNEDLMKHLKLRHGITLLESGENYNQTVETAKNQTLATVTKTAAESTSSTRDTKEASNSASREPPQKKIRLVPLEKLLDPKTKSAQIEQIEQRSIQPAPFKIVQIVTQNPGDHQLVTQQPNEVYITQTMPLQASQTSEYQTYLCKYTCIHCSTRFESQEQLASHWKNSMSCPAKWSIFICYHCSMKFANFNLLSAHWSQPRNCSSTQPNSSFRYRIAGNLEISLPDAVTNSFLDAMSKLPNKRSICFQCPDCSQAYFDQQICLNHIKSKMKMPYFCTYTQEVILYGCDECKVFFLKEQDAIRHISMHTFRYACIFCQSAYRTQDELYAHYVKMHRSIERSHKYDATSPRNMEIYREMLVVFPYGLVLTKWNLRGTIWGNMILFARLIEEVTNENSTTAVQT